VISNGGTGITQKHIYGDAFEAMMGAVYLDQGYEFVNRLLINNIYFRFLNLEELTESESDFKSRLRHPGPGSAPRAWRACRETIFDRSWVIKPSSRSGYSMNR